MKCPRCGFENPRGFAFCGNCGSPLGGPAAAPRALREERKIVTILFADISGSTALGERLDPERVRAIMARFFEAMAAIVHDYGGTVEKFIGDEIMAVFGLPAAHEDDPERAVRSAVAMRERLTDLRRELHLPSGWELQMRIGINTGEVVADPGAVEKGDFMVTGDAVNVAARLRAAAAPGATIVGEQVHQRTRWLADFRETAPLTLKGKTERVRGWELIAMRAEPEPRRAGRRAPLVGRERELTLLRSVLHRVIQERTPHLIAVLGPPGAGKTRLVEELLATYPELAVRLGRSIPYGGTALWAMGEIIRADCGILRSDPVGPMTDKLRSRAAALFGDSAGSDEIQDVIAQLSRVLAVHTAEVPAPDEDSRESLFWALRRYAEAMAAAGPVVLAFEDAHFAEAEMLDLIEHIAGTPASPPLLIICLGRPELLEARPHWGSARANFTTLSLAPLTEGDVQALTAGVLGSEPPPALFDVVKVAAGNPLFVEEILRMLIDAGSLVPANGRWEIRGPLAVRVPDTVQGVIASRLDQLGREERTLLMEAAVLGKVFWTGALARLTDGDEARLTPALTVLAAKNFLEEHPQSRLAGQREYAFTSLITRDVAYGMLPKSRRAQRHAAFGGWLEETLGARTEEFAELVAHHWRQALRLKRDLSEPGWLEVAPHAVRAALLAGRKALRLYAHDQAIAHFETARTVAEDMGDEAQQVAAIEGLADVYAIQAQWDQASSLYRTALAFHERRGDAVRQARVQSRIASTFSGVFDFRQALPHIQAALSKLAPDRHALELAGIHVQMARAQTYIGNFTDAEEYARTGLALAQEYGLAALIADAKIVRGMIHSLTGGDDAGAEFDEATRIAEGAGEEGRVVAACAGKAYFSRHRGDYATALASLQQALSISERIRVRSRIAQCCSFLGDVHFLRGEWPAAAGYWERYLSFADEVPSWVESGKSMLAFVHGHFEEALEWSQQAVARAERRRDVAELGPAVDWSGTVMVHLGRWNEAAAFVSEACDRFTPLGVVFPAFLHPLAAEAALGLGDLDRAREHCHLAEAYGRMSLRPAQARLYRAKGLLAAAEARLNDAASALEEAVREYAAIGQPYEAARAMEALAEVLRRRTAPEDHRRSAQLAGEVMQLYRRIGADFEVRRLQDSGPA